MTASTVPGEGTAAAAAPVPLQREQALTVAPGPCPACGSVLAPADLARWLHGLPHDDPHWIVARVVVDLRAERAARRLAGHQVHGGQDWSRWARECIGYDVLHRRRYPWLYRDDQPGAAS